MENISVNLQDIHFLLLILPGFVLVWTYRRFTKPRPIGDFEYAGLSFIWGFLLVGLTGHVLEYLPKQSNPYGIVFWFCIFGALIGWFGSFVARWEWVKKLINYFRPENFGK